MGRLLKSLGIAGVIVCASSAAAATNASAAAFRASKTGELTGVATSAQFFETASGTVTCTEANTSGFVTETETTEQEVTVEYSGCTAFGFAGVTVSPAEYDLHANGELDIVNTVTINVPIAGCTVTVPAQSRLTSVSYVNQSGKIEELGDIAGIAIKGSGGLCGGESANGTYTGNDLVELVGGNIEAVGALGGALSKQVFVEGVEMTACNFLLEKEICQIKISVKGAGGGWRVEGNKWEGEEPEARYELTEGCKKGTLLKEGANCIDKIKMIKKVAGARNEWCVFFELEDGSIKRTPVCTKLKM